MARSNPFPVFTSARGRRFRAKDYGHKAWPIEPYTGEAERLYQIQAEIEVARDFAEVSGKRWRTEGGEFTGAKSFLPKDLVRLGISPQEAERGIREAQTGKPKTKAGRMILDMAKMGRAHLNPLPSGFGAVLKKYRKAGLSAGDAMRKTWAEFKGPYAHGRNPKRGRPPRSRFCPERLDSPDRFDPRSFRTVTVKGHRVTVGCPKGKYDAKAKRCKVGLRAQRVLHPQGEGKCPVTGKEIGKNPGAAWHFQEARLASLAAERTQSKEAKASRWGKADAHIRSAIESQHLGMNPSKPVTIYDRLLELRAQKGRKSAYAGQRFKHAFRSGAKVYGMPDGSLLIKGPRRLWRNFPA